MPRYPRYLTYLQLLTDVGGVKDRRTEAPRDGTPFSMWCVTERQDFSPGFRLGPLLVLADSTSPPA